MIFWRTYNNQIHPIGEVEQLGFPIEDPSYIPDDYLEGQKFIILRTCFGVGVLYLHSPESLRKNILIVLSFSHPLRYCKTCLGSLNPIGHLGITPLMLLKLYF